LETTKEAARVAGNLSKIRTEHHLNMSPERYRYTNPFGIKSIVERISDCLILSIVQRW
jgi:hypothetical protein